MMGKLEEKKKNPEEYHLILTTANQIGEISEFRKLMMKYRCAIREVQTKLEVLNEDFSVRNNRNPIEALSSRIKTPESIVEKLHRNHWPITTKSIHDNLHDVAGVRVICSFVDDIYYIADVLLKQDDIR